MPFTLVHPVAVLPLARGPLTLLPLTCGAIAPDLPYYLRATPLPVTAESWYGPYVNATTSHSLAGLLSVSLPLALAVYLCGSLALPPLRWMADMRPRTASGTDLLRTLGRGAWIFVSLLVGVLTHLAWDGLTEVGDSDSRLLQHGSTALGALILALVAWRRRTVLTWYEPTVRGRFLAVAVACAAAALAGAAIAGWSWIQPAAGINTGEVVEGIMAAAAKGSGAGLTAVAAVLVLAWWAVQLLGRHRDPAHEQ